jgi:hypothetical protein
MENHQSLGRLRNRGQDENVAAGEIVTRTQYLPHEKDVFLGLATISQCSQGRTGEGTTES